MIKVDKFNCDVEDPEVEDGEVELGGVAGEVGVAITVVSPTVTWKLPTLVLPAVSVEKQLTVVVPTPKVEPEAGEQIAETDASKLSVAETE
jgi:hypothetical protein